jgi:geranylgeranyl diphosphate synthase type I
MPDPQAAAPPTFIALRARIDDALTATLESAEAESAAIDPGAAPLVDEVRRLVEAGGKRLRPAFCYWGYRAAGGPDGDAIVDVAAAIELLHTMALIHDDLMDGARERRGMPASARYLASEASRLGAPSDPERFGNAAAILAGDLAAVLADRCLLDSGFAPEALMSGLRLYHRMRLEMAAGQFLDVAGLAATPGTARRSAVLKGGSYTVEGPLLIGAALASAASPVTGALRRFGAPLGEAFQLRDDLHDGEGAHGATPDEVNGLIAQARAALDPDILDPDAVAALDGLAGSLAMP